MNFKVDIPEISAETLLNYLYPELEQRWKVRNEGSFFRNYNRDFLSVSPENEEVFLTRDGMLQLLPQAIISPEEELINRDKKEKFKEIQLRKKILQESFLPIDTVLFRRKLKVEREISTLLNEKLSYILKTYFGIDSSVEKNPYVKELLPLLPYIRNRKGDLMLVKNLLKSLFNCQVNLLSGRYSHYDNSLKWIPLIRYELIIEKLNNKDFNEISNRLGILKEFLAEWFLPAEIKCEILIKDHRESNVLNGKLTLDYNTEI